MAMYRVRIPNCNNHSLFYIGYLLSAGLSEMMVERLLWLSCPDALSFFIWQLLVLERERLLLKMKILSQISSMFYSYSRQFFSSFRYLSIRKSLFISYTYSCWIAFTSSFFDSRFSQSYSTIFPLCSQDYSFLWWMLINLPISLFSISISLEYLQQFSLYRASCSSHSLPSLSSKLRPVRYSSASHFCSICRFSSFKPTIYLHFFDIYSWRRAICSFMLDSTLSQIIFSLTWDFMAFWQSFWTCSLKDSSLTNIYWIFVRFASYSAFKSSTTALCFLYFSCSALRALSNKDYASVFASFISSSSLLRKDYYCWAILWLSWRISLLLLSSLSWMACWASFWILWWTSCLSCAMASSLSLRSWSIILTQPSLSSLILSRSYLMVLAWSCFSFCSWMQTLAFSCAWSSVSLCSQKMRSLSSTLSRWSYL